MRPAAYAVALREALLESAIDAVIVMDSSGRVREFNPAACRLFGYAQQEAIGSLLSDLIIPEQMRAAHQSGLQRFLATGEGPVLRRRVEVHGMASDGTEVPVELGIVPFQAGGEQLFVAHLRDLRPRRQAEEELVRRQRTIHTLQEVPILAQDARSVEEAAAIGLRHLCEVAGWEVGHAWFLSQEGRLESRGVWHAAAPERWETFRQDTAGRTFHEGEGMPGRAWAEAKACWETRLDDAARFPRAASAVAAGLRTGLAFPLLHNGRTLAVLELFTTHRRAPDETMLAVLTAVGLQLGRVMHRQQAIEAEIARARASLLETQEIARLGTWEWDAADARLEASDTAQALLGLRAQEPPGAGATLDAVYLSCVHPDDEPVVARHLQAALQRHEPQAFDHRTVAGLLLHARLRPVVRDGRLVRLLGTLQDVTEERARERQLREAAHANELSEVRARFLNIAAHELKTPLTPIRLQVQILSRLLGDGAPEPQARALATLERCVGRLTELVNDILDAARVQATQLRMRRQPVDLAAVAREAAAAYMAVAEQGRVALAVDAPGPAVVDGDPGRMLQVASNLVSNAVKFTPAGGRVHVQVTREGAVCRLRVRDTGLGLTAAQRERLFQPFSQVHAEAAVPGTGLGLFIVRGIVEQCGGRVTARSEGPGLGSTFEVELPAAPTLVAAADGARPADPVETVVAS